MKKVIKVNSKEHFWKILNKFVSLQTSNPKFIDFCHSMEEYYYGCDCTRDEYIRNVTEMYKNFSEDEQLKREIIDFFNVDAIIITVPD